MTENGPICRGEDPHLIDSDAGVTPLRACNRKVTPLVKRRGDTRHVVRNRQT